MVVYDYLFLNNNCATQHPAGELIIGNNSENADVSYFSGEYNVSVKATKQMKLCKLLGEQLYQQREHEPTQLWHFPQTQWPRQCHGDGIACTQGS